MVCVTKGDKGALLYCEGDFYEHPGFKVNAVDTVGAGDAFPRRINCITAR
ncbi:MAG: hypothetical protein IPF54_27855 [Draconibacterium sp.]|nr:hypothetical protein [Draconibacterium sp.]